MILTLQSRLAPFLVSREVRESFIIRGPVLLRQACFEGFQSSTFTPMEFQQKVTRNAKQSWRESIVIGRVTNVWRLQLSVEFAIGAVRAQISALLKSYTYTVGEFWKRIYTTRSRARNNPDHMHFPDMIISYACDIRYLISLND